MSTPPDWYQPCVHCKRLVNTFKYHAIIKKPGQDRVYIHPACTGNTNIEFSEQEIEYRNEWAREVVPA
jgi:hypothetical protein